MAGLAGRRDDDLKIGVSVKFRLRGLVPEIPGIAPVRCREAQSRVIARHRTQCYVFCGGSSDCCTWTAM